MYIWNNGKHTVNSRKQHHFIVTKLPLFSMANLWNTFMISLNSFYFHDEPCYIKMLGFKVGDFLKPFYISYMYKYLR